MISLIVVSVLAAAFSPVITKKLSSNTVVAGATKAISSIRSDCASFNTSGGVCSVCTDSLCLSCTLDNCDENQGKYKNIGFCQADVHIEEEHQSTDSEGHTTTHYVTIFRGRWMIFDFNKTFKANVQVCQKGFGNNKVINSIFSKSTRYQKIQMESTDFNKRFLVYAQDAHDAFYIITPHIMEKIIKLSGDSKGKILLCFINNQLHVGLYDNDDSFEPSSCFSTIDTERVTQDVLSDINKITMFVDELELDNDLFKSKNVN